MRRELGPRHFLTGALVIASLLAPAAAEAAPIEASASAPHEEGSSDRARDEAVTAARKAALEQAIAEIEIAVDETAVQQVLARAEAWTGGYRLLEVVDEGGTLTVTIEAEIDLPRLRKRIAKTSKRESSGGLIWAGLRSEGCGSLSEDQLLDPLRAYEIVADEGDTKLAIEVRCIDRGAVSHTHVEAAAVELVASTSGAVERRVELSTQGFSEDIAAAREIALDRAVSELADELAVQARGDLELRVEQPWPAARVGILESRLRDAVLGVDRAELAGIAADGTAILRVVGEVEIEALGRQLQGLSFPGFRLVGLRVDTPHALRVRMQ